MDTGKWPQEFIVKPINEIVVTNTCLKQPNPPMERKARPEKDQALNCPRCNSLNTKFCYYNNYSLTQPRYFCKDCRRYWTEGGSLRNIPVGGGVRKNKRSSSSSISNSNSSSPSSSPSSKKTLFANNSSNTPAPLPQLNPKIGGESAKAQDLAFSQGFGNPHEVKDLNLAFSQGFAIGLHHHHHHSIPEFLQVLPSNMKNNSLVSTSSALELLGISNTSVPSTSCPAFMSYPNVHDSSVYAASGFGLSYPQFQEFMRPALGFSLEGGNPLHQEEGSSGTTTATNNGRPLLPFESLKHPVSSSSTNSGAHGNGNDNESEREGEQSAVGLWNGMLSGGASASAASAGGGSWQ